jgi:hypothetical protein
MTPAGRRLYDCALSSHALPARGRGLTSMPISVENECSNSAQGALIYDA